ncbi:MAG: PQQ-binding-like beta-propeller repeat protein, partial [Candidatus Hydrogenedentales bacterium]
GGVGDVTDTHVVWKMTEDAPHESSPVLVGDLLYTMGDKGMLICMEATTGKQVWSQRMPNDIWASLLATNDRIYLLDKKGGTTIIATGREYRELAVNALDGEVMASPAVAGDSLLLRTKTHLYRIQEKK